MFLTSPQEPETEQHQSQRQSQLQKGGDEQAQGGEYLDPFQKTNPTLLNQVQTQHNAHLLTKRSKHGIILIFLGCFSSPLTPNMWQVPDLPIALPMTEFPFRSVSWHSSNPSTSLWKFPFLPKYRGISMSFTNHSHKPLRVSVWSNREKPKSQREETSSWGHT